MRADTSSLRWPGLPRASVLLPASVLLACVLMTTGCASLPPPPGRGPHLGYSPLGDTTPPVAPPLGGAPPRAHVSPPPASSPGAEVPQRLHRHRGAREAVTSVGPGGGAAGEASPRAVEPGEQSPGVTREAVLAAMAEVKDSLGVSARALPGLAAHGRGLGGFNDAFSRYLTYATQQVQWVDGALGGAATLADAASHVADADLQRSLLRLSGPRLQAALLGAMLLAAWLDFLHLADVVLRQCPAYSVERLFMDLHRVKKLMEPTLAALASLDSAQVEAAATAMPELMGQLAGQFSTVRDGARTAMENRGQLLAAVQWVEMLTLMSTLRLSLPRLPPAAPVTLGVGLVMGSGGVMTGSRLVVSAEWVERMRRLVQAGVISAPVVSAAVRLHAGGAMMAQAHGDLPPGVRDALGDGPEVRGMHETGRAGAGMAEPPKHHVLPREHREWFEKRGFTGAMDIDQFCVRLEAAHHQAIHGGGNWRLGRTWPGEWNRLVMNALYRAETRAGRMLTRNETLNEVAQYMKRYDILMNFTSWRGR